MPYTLRLKIYTNPNLPKGNVIVPEEPVTGQGAPLLHVNPEDYHKILKIIAMYYKGAFNGTIKEEDEGSGDFVSNKDSGCNCGPDRCSGDCDCKGEDGIFTKCPTCGSPPEHTIEDCRREARTARDASSRAGQIDYGF